MLEYHKILQYTQIYFRSIWYFRGVPLHKQAVMLLAVQYDPVTGPFIERTMRIAGNLFKKL
jgi:hypothetical protein